MKRPIQLKDGKVILDVAHIVGVFDCEGDKHCCIVLLESDVIGVEPHDEEEYQLYLKLKEKYG